jgi:hypothetical protein
MSENPVDPPELEDKKEKEIGKLEHLSKGLDESKSHQSITYDFGICNKCTHFLYTEFEGYGNFSAFCLQIYNRPIPRQVSERVMKCSSFWDKGHKTIRELYDLATWITPAGAKRIGFDSNK